MASKPGSLPEVRLVSSVNLRKGSDPMKSVAKNLNNVGLDSLIPTILRLRDKKIHCRSAQDRRDDRKERGHLMSVIFRINSIALDDDPAGTKSNREK
jgi:hypothetical protein